VGSLGWKGWARNVDRMNLKRRKAFYGDWWDKAAQWRTGGFDRLCAGAPGSPTTEEIRARGIKGSLFLNEILTVRPGTQLEFLAAVVRERVPLMTEYGHRPTGLYEVASNQHEVVMLWATDIPSQVRLRQSRDRTRGLCDEGEIDERLVKRITERIDVAALEWTHNGLSPDAVLIGLGYGRTPRVKLGSHFFDSQYSDFRR